MDIFHLLQLAIVLLVSISSSTGLPLLTPHPDSTHRLLSAATGRYVSITKSGRVHANGEINHKNPAKDATPLIFQRIHSDEEQSHLRIGSVKYSNKNWFIVITAEDAIRATVPSSGSEVLEEVGLIDGSIVLRVVNYSDIVSAMKNDGSGSSLESEDSDLLTPEVITEPNEPQCYIGFSTETGRAQCYDNVDNINVRLHVLPVA